MKKGGDPMNGIKTSLLRGLNAWQIKVIAVIAMTVDHLAAYGFEIPLFDAYYDRLRLIGRIAMPLFLFLLTDSIRYTRSRPKFLLRLYLAAVGTGLFTTVTNYFFGYTVGHFRMSNIFYTYLYVAIYVILIESILDGIRAGNWKKLLLSAGGIAATAVVHQLSVFLNRISFMDMGLTLEQSMLVKELLESVITSPWMVEYTMLFVLMGVLMYFAGNKYGKTAVLVCFSFLCYFGSRLVWDGSAFGDWLTFNTPFHTVLSVLQSRMILAAPIMLLYNGKKGRSDKWFFYLYYPLHRYVIAVIEYLYVLFFAA